MSLRRNVVHKRVVFTAVVACAMLAPAPALAVSGSSGSGSAGAAQYPQYPVPLAPTGVSTVTLSQPPDQSGQEPETAASPEAPTNEEGNGAPNQQTRTVEQLASEEGDRLPFTGLPLLAMLSGGGLLLSTAFFARRAGRAQAESSL